MGKLSSEMHLSLWNAISCPRSRQLSWVTFKGDCAILALRNYKMQAEKRYSYLIIVKILTPFRSIKHSRDSLKMRFVVYKAVTATLLHSMYFRCHYRASGTVLTQRFGLPSFNNISHSLANRGVCCYHSSSGHTLLLQDL